MRGGTGIGTGSIYACEIPVVVVLHLCKHCQAATGKEEVVAYRDNGSHFVGVDFHMVASIGFR